MSQPDKVYYRLEAVSAEPAPGKATGALPAFCVRCRRGVGAGGSGPALCVPCFEAIRSGRTGRMPGRGTVKETE